jgi:deazaflavin-dependent oxidoreductase (nitroreductase family)
VLERGRTVHGKSLADRVFFAPSLIEPVGFVMSREMLRGIKVRAERAAGSTPVPIRTPPRWLNAVMTALLHTPGLQRLIGRSVALLTVTGRRTGARYTIPVTYVRAGDTVRVITKTARTWWRNLPSNPDVELRLAGRRRVGRAEVAAGDPASVPALVHFLERRRRDARAYGIAVSAAGRVDRSQAAAVLPRLVIITVTLAETAADR